MLKIMDEILKSGVNEENCFFIDLDSRKYSKVKTKQALEELLDSYSNINVIKYVFIDEIQNIKDFEEVINSFRNDGDYSIFITGSNSYLLSGELVTKLIGRYIEFEIFTLSFYEYLEMKKFFNKPIDSKILNELNNYITEGGFPKAIQYDSIIDKKLILKQLLLKYLKRILKEELRLEQ